MRKFFLRSPSSDAVCNPDVEESMNYGHDPPQKFGLPRRTDFVGTTVKRHDARNGRSCLG